MFQVWFHVNCLTNYIHLAISSSDSIVELDLAEMLNVARGGNEISNKVFRELENLRM